MISIPPKNRFNFRYQIDIDTSKKKKAGPNDPALIICWEKDVVAPVIRRMDRTELKKT
jgi:hypothetical protein